MLMYGTTKFAVRGFMETLETDLYIQGHSSYIKMSTIYPCFVNSNKNLKSFVDNLWELPGLLAILDVEYVAKLIVDAIKCNHRTVTIPRIQLFLGYYM